MNENDENTDLDNIENLLNGQDFDDTTSNLETDTQNGNDVNSDTDEKNGNDIEIVTGDGKNLDISKVYDHIKLEKQSQPNKEEIIIPHKSKIESD